MTDLRWKPIDQYVRGPYCGATEMVVVGWEAGHYSFGDNPPVVFFAVSWLEDGRGWMFKDEPSNKPYSVQPTHFLMVLNGITKEEK